MNGYKMIRIRRASDNAEKDFNFSDLKAMKEWAHGSDCYIAPSGAYDQAHSQFSSLQNKFDLK